MADDDAHNAATHAALTSITGGKPNEAQRAEHWRAEIHVKANELAFIMNQARAEGFNHIVAQIGLTPFGWEAGRPVVGKIFP